MDNRTLTPVPDAAYPDEWDSVPESVQCTVDTPGFYPDARGVPEGVGTGTPEPRTPSALHQWAIDREEGGGLFLRLVRPLLMVWAVVVYLMFILMPVVLAIAGSARYIEQDTPTLLLATGVLGGTVVASMMRHTKRQLFFTLILCVIAGLFYE